MKYFLSKQYSNAKKLHTIIEVFKPATREGENSLMERLNRLATLNPALFSISSQNHQHENNTLSLTQLVREDVCAEVQVHLQCDEPLEILRANIASAKAFNVRHFLFFVLRQPQALVQEGGEVSHDSVAIEEALKKMRQLLHLLGEEQSIGVMVPYCDTRDEQIWASVARLACPGIDYVVLPMIATTQSYSARCNLLTKHGVRCPIVPAIVAAALNARSLESLINSTTAGRDEEWQCIVRQLLEIEEQIVLSGRTHRLNVHASEQGRDSSSLSAQKSEERASSTLRSFHSTTIHRIKKQKAEAIQAFWLSRCVELVEGIQECGSPGVYLVSLNLESVVKKVAEACGLREGGTLPWRPRLEAGQGEQIRPIHWANNPKRLDILFSHF
uniref:Methylenetetrahydrofolate reductase (NAD(P)H) n=1 Tax=Palpitomonas bilix TaxID=652834 RepID=A0A7S3DCU0_9EUKA|mmetsp:Transcript_3146/g.6062  ORF Transcript_3146/g.6062 Transcript_3146/m.6062 type:complete len:386 (+) Transcript_3146:106-1263(+)